MEHEKISEILKYTISYLSLETENIKLFKNVTGNYSISFLKAISPNTSYFLYLYKEVGRKYEWTDWLRSERSKLESFLTDDNVILYSLILRGVPKGFFVLDYRHLPICDLAYFGLFDDAIGKGLGKLMMNRAFEEVIEKGDAKTLTVNTNTLDHKNALPLYQKAGFNIYKTESHKRSALSHLENKEYL
tara:strand:- start:1286 stop:1849 length:564 start_codon:yes stop_codon:yes gene_type:complete